MKKKMPAKDLKKYKESLLNLKEDILGQIREISEDTLMKSQKDISGDISGYGLHIADVASDNYDREFNLGLVSGDREILLEVEEALKRIEDKTYGICHECNNFIAPSRLEAVPYARNCKNCQEKLDKEKNRK